MARQCARTGRHGTTSATTRRWTRPNARCDKALCARPESSARAVGTQPGSLGVRTVHST